MTSQGSAYARFQRALSSGNAMVAWATAAELPSLSLEDALALCLLLVDSDPERYERAALRWHARLCHEVRGLTIDEAGLCLASLRALPGRGGAPAGHALVALCEAHGLERATARLERWLHRTGAG